MLLQGVMSSAPYPVGGGAPAFAFVGNLTWVGIAGETTTLDLTNGGAISVQEDDLAVVVAMNDSGAAAGGAYVQSAGWTTLYQATFRSALMAGLFYKILGSGETTVSLRAHNSATTATPFAITIYRGIDPVTPLEGHAGPTDGGSGMPDPASYAPVSTPVLRIVAGMLDDINPAYTAPAGYSNLIKEGWTSGSNGGSVALAGKIDTVGGAEDPAAFGGGGTDIWVASHLAFNVVGAV